jgi:hypothetical protein
MSLSHFLDALASPLRPLSNDRQLCMATPTGPMIFRLLTFGNCISGLLYALLASAIACDVVWQYKRTLLAMFDFS